MNPNLNPPPDAGGKRKKQRGSAPLTVTLQQNGDTDLETIDDALKIFCKGMMRAYLEDHRGQQ